MLPCQHSCPDYTQGCHKTCAQWKAFQVQQKIDWRKKRAYLSYYNELCATRIRQFNALAAGGRLRQ